MTRWVTGFVAAGVLAIAAPAGAQTGTDGRASLSTAATTPDETVA